MFPLLLLSFLFLACAYENKPSTSTSTSTRAIEAPAYAPSSPCPSPTLDAEIPAYALPYKPKPSTDQSYEPSPTPSYNSLAYSPSYETPSYTQSSSPKYDTPVIYGVQGAIYCSSCCDFKPIQGAVAKISCEGKEYKSSTFSMLTRKTDKNSYFTAKFTQKQLGDHLKPTDCKVYLESSPLYTCNVTTNTNLGLTGAPLTSSDESLNYMGITHTFKLYSGPAFTYTSYTKCTKPKYPSPPIYNTPTPIYTPKSSYNAPTYTPYVDTPKSTNKAPTYAPDVYTPMSSYEAPMYAPSTTYAPPAYTPMSSYEAPAYAPSTTYAPPVYTPMSSYEAPAYAPGDTPVYGPESSYKATYNAPTPNVNSPKPSYVAPSTSTSTVYSPESSYTAAKNVSPSVDITPLSNSTDAPKPG